MQLQGKRMIQTQENGEKPNFGLDLDPLSPNSSRHSPPLPPPPLKNLVLSVTKYHGQLSSRTILQKTNDPILIKFSDGRTDGQTARQTDERE